VTPPCFDSGLREPNACRSAWRLETSPRLEPARGTVGRADDDGPTADNSRWSLRDPSLTATASSSAHDSNGRFSAHRRYGLSIPRLAGFRSISPHTTARSSTCRSALGRVEAMPGRDRHPPGGDLLRREFSYPQVAEPGYCVAKQPAQLRDRHRLRVMLTQVLLDQLRRRQGPREPLFTAQPLERAPERLLCVLVACESAALDALRATAAGPIAVAAGSSGDA
jgi:hypothetical protein